MLILVLRTAILMAAMLSGCLQAGTLDDIRALKLGKTDLAHLHWMDCVFLRATHHRHQDSVKRRRPSGIR